MPQEVRYEARLRAKKSRFFKKKTLLNHQVPVNRGYSFKLSVWIPDTPGDNRRPSIVVTLQHNADKISFSFNEVADMVYAFGEMEHYLNQKAEMLYSKHQEALQEWASYHEQHAPLTKYSYTDTVIQGEDGQRLVIDPKTGEILGRLTPLNNESETNPQKQENQ
jgi:hypothetical protein